MKTLQEKIMRLFIRSSFFLIIFSVLTTLYFVTSAYADHTPHAHKPRKPGLPGYNEACDNINGSFRANTPLVGQLDPTVDEKGRPTEQCINFTRYGYPINPGEPGYIDRNVPPSTFGRPPRDSDQYSIACDSRQDTSPYGNNTWESGSCVDDAGRPCCINQTLEGYPIKIGEPGYVIQDFQREQCKNPDSLPRFIRDSPEFKQVCDLIAQEGSTPQPGSPVTGPGGSPAQAELARTTAARQELEQQLNNAQATLSEVEEAKGAAERQLAAAQDALASATAALQAAEQAVQQETEQQAADLAIAEQAVQDAQQQLELVNTELMTADRALIALQEQKANAEEKLASLKARQDEGVRILNDAKAKVAQLTGMSFVGDIQDSTVDAGTGSGSLPLQWACIPLHQIGSPQDGLGGPGSIIDIPGGDPEDATSPNDIAGGCLRLIVDGTAYGDISINQPKMSDLGNSDFNYIQTQANGDFDGQTGRVLSQTISYIKEYLKITGGPVVTNVVTGAKSIWFLGKVVNGSLTKVEGSSDLFSNINSLSESDQFKLFAAENERRRQAGTLNVRWEYLRESYQGSFNTFQSLNVEEQSKLFAAEHKRRQQ